jgi:hypothetical protein
MKKLLLTVATALACFAGANAQTTDPSVYEAVDGYSLKNLWIRSLSTESSPVDLLGSFSNCRGMAIKDGQMLLPSKTLEKISEVDYFHHHFVVLDANTGAFIKNINVSDDIGLGSYDMNDVAIDADGNVLVANLCFNLITEGGFKVSKVNLEDGSVTPVLASAAVQEEGDTGMRIDAFDVYGSVDGDGYILAAVAGKESGIGDMVFRWNIVGGVVNPEPVGIQIQNYYPASITSHDSAPRVATVDNDYFYLDIKDAPVALYDMDGGIVESFESAPDLNPNEAGVAGVDEFQMDDKTFIVYAYNSYPNAETPSTVAVSALGEGQKFEGMQQYFVMPKMGMGNGTNFTRILQPKVEVKDGVANIYIYAAYSGVAAYKFGLTENIADGIQDVVARPVVTTVEKGIAVSEASDVEVYNFLGQKVADAAKTTKVALPAGNYIVKVANGASTTTTKVIIK